MEQDQEPGAALASSAHRLIMTEIFGIDNPYPHYTDLLCGVSYPHYIDISQRMESPLCLWTGRCAIPIKGFLNVWVYHLFISDSTSPEPLSAAAFIYSLQAIGVSRTGACDISTCIGNPPKSRISGNIS